MKAKIPSSGEILPRIGLGSYRNFDIELGSSKETSMSQILHSFCETGGRLLDSSPMYGRSESALGVISNQLNINDSLFVATKVWTSGQEAGIQQMESSFKKLGRQNQQIELMQIHNLVDWKIHLATLRKWKQEGRIKYIGLTHYSTQAFSELKEILESEKGIDFLQIPYSIGRTEAADFLIPTAKDRGVAVIANEPFAQGQAFRKSSGKSLPPVALKLGIKNWAEYFLKFILASKEIQFVIPATGNPKHLGEFLNFENPQVPDAQEAAEMKKAFEQT